MHTLLTNLTPWKLSKINPSYIYKGYPSQNLRMKRLMQQVEQVEQLQ
jgi:hypothetical protein